VERRPVVKIKIGKHVRWVGPYQIVDWFKPVFGEERIEKFTDGKLFEKVTDVIQPFFEWVHRFQKRKIDIHIDSYDVWNMDHTLAMIILPMLVKLQANKNGSPLVEDEDIPEELSIRSTDAPKCEDWETDDNVHKRWAWVMDEMIWTFTQLVDEDGDRQFFKSTPYDKEGYEKYHKRINEGLMLFGKYYRGLWD